MAIISNNIGANVFNFTTLLAQGGDPDARIALGSSADPVSRGMHLLTRYVAPLDYYHEQWTGRVQDAMRQSIEDWREVAADHDQRYYTQDARNAVASSLDVASSALQGTITSWDNAVSGYALDQVNRRASLQIALAQVEGLAQAQRVGHDLYITDTSDLNRIADTFNRMDADQGLASTRTIGDAIQMAGQVQQIQHQRYQLIESQAQLAGAQEAERAEREARKGMMIGNLIGTAAGLLL